MDDGLMDIEMLGKGPRIFRKNSSSPDWLTDWPWQELSAQEILDNYCQGKLTYVILRNGAFLREGFVFVFSTFYVTACRSQSFRSHDVDQWK